MIQEIFNEEKEKLAEVEAKLQGAYKVLESSLDVMGKDNLETLKDLRENPETQGLDAFVFIEQLSEKNEAFNIKDKFKRMEEFGYLLKEPYFSRVDLKENDSTAKSFYIGKFGYTEDDPVIIDWRAKIASVYYRYRYPQNNVSYETPDGVETRDLTLKRTFEIDNANLIKYYNNDLQLDENEIISDKIAKRTGGVLEDIIETIQVSQLDIIESDPRQMCIVQGCVGSGKSTVAIHKLAHIFFNYPNLIRPERSILIAKNQILVSYLSTLFPKLGIFDINYKTVKDLLINVIFREKLKINYDLKKLETIIPNLKIINKIKEELKKVHAEYEGKIDAIFEKEEFENFGSYVYDSNQSVSNNILDMVTDLEEEMEFQKEKLKDYPKSVKAWLYKSNITDLRKLINSLKALERDLVDTAIKNVLSKLSIGDKNIFSYNESLLYIFIYAKIIGINNSFKFDYCVVDEGQDFSLFEYLLLNELVINGRMCILGDLNQAYEESSITRWEDITDVVESAKNANTFTLDTNFRSTKPIIDLANSILCPYTSSYLPKSINRKGEEPKIKTCDSFKDLLESFSEELKEDIKEINKSVGIILCDQAMEEGVLQVIEKTKIKKDRFIKLVETQKMRYIPAGIYLMSFDNCKGLEFSKVYVIDLNLANISSFSTAKKAFVAVTRAMNELSVYGINKKIN